MIVKANLYMHFAGRPPLFKDPRDIVGCYDLRDELFEYKPETECNTIMNCNSREEYVPPKCEEHWLIDYYCKPYHSSMIESSLTSTLDSIWSDPIKKIKKIEEINQWLLSFGNHPLVEIPKACYTDDADAILDVFENFIKLFITMSEKESNKILNCNSYDEYNPKMYEGKRLIDYYSKNMVYYNDTVYRYKVGFHIPLYTLDGVLSAKISKNFGDIIDFLKHEDRPYYEIEDKIPEELKNDILCDVKYFEYINKCLHDNKRPPLFDDPRDLVSCYALREKLLKFRPEEECNEIMHCKSYEDYEPPIR